MFDQVARHEHAEVDGGAAAFAESVIAIGIGDVVEPFAKFDEPIDQSLDDLEVGVPLASAVNDEQAALQALGEVDGRRATVAFGIRLGRLHVNSWNHAL